MILDFYKSQFGPRLNDRSSFRLNEDFDDELMEEFEDHFLKFFRLGSFTIPREQAKQIRQKLKDSSGDCNEFISIGKVSNNHGQEQFYITDNDTEETLFFEIDSRNKKEEV